MTIDTFLFEACVVLSQDIERLQPLVHRLKDAISWEEKNQIISQEEKVLDFLQKPSYIKEKLGAFPLKEQVAIKSLIAIGQADRIFHREDLTHTDLDSRMQELLDLLLTLEKSYREIGGIIGYHLAMITLLCRPQQKPYGEKAQYLSPKMIDISSITDPVKNAIFYAIENLEQVAELYPVGGAADRLKLFDPITSTALPAAKLFFCGMTLLERLVVDVQAKEFLFYKIYGRQISVPIAMMTSVEKKNHDRIMTLLEKCHYFNRDKKSFFIFCQPLVPTIDQEGKWALEGPLRPLLRPGGHGVVWKLAKDSGCFDWLQDKGIKKMLVRQINNPIASEDYGLFAFSGFGLLQDKAIGFSSCPRVVKSAEGTNVLIREEKEGKTQYTLTNIEYCDFPKYGIADEPAKQGESFSKFPSNTNLLFVDLKQIEKALEDTPIPGMLVNLKKISYRDERGQLQDKLLARLESMMQNIADCFTATVDNSSDEDLSLNAYITYNDRRKTISTTKKEYLIGASMMETPEGCFLDMMQNARDLLERCKFSFLESKGVNPSFIFLYHPSLGPMHSIIAQKLRGGWLSENAELELQISEVDIQNLFLEGSLVIKAEQPMGHLNDEAHLKYSLLNGKCTLKNVKIKNSGIDFSRPSVLWKGDFTREQCCSITIKGNGELIAEDVMLKGDWDIIVESGYKVTLKDEDGSVVMLKEKISQPSWQWLYQFDSEKNLVLTRENLL